MSNARTNPRFPMSGLVEVKIQNGDGKFSGMIELISLGGVGIYTKQKVVTSTPVSLQIVSFSGAGTMNYSLRGIVKNHDRYNEFGVVGIQFEKPINPEDQPHLFDFLQEQERKLNHYLSQQ